MIATPNDYGLLKELSAVFAPSGNEVAMRDFLLAYVARHSKTWRCVPQLVYGEEWQDNLILVFGKPRTAVFAHMDSVGFTVRYGKQLVRIGSPVCESGFRLMGNAAAGTPEAVLQVIHNDDGTRLEYTAGQALERGTELVFAPNWCEDENFVQCCYMDNRAGVYMALKLAETLEHGAIVFSTWEEHGGGSVPYLQKYLHETYAIRQALIADVAWVTDGVFLGEGAVISMRDSLLPRRTFLNKVIAIARRHKCHFQLEVEGSGGSDASELQAADNPWDWCFIGPPVDEVHSPNEKLHKGDIEAAVFLYKSLMAEL